MGYKLLPAHFYSHYKNGYSEQETIQEKLGGRSLLALYSIYAANFLV